MKSPDEPQRLLDDASDIGRELKLGLESMSSNLPSAEQLAGMAARLGVTPNAPVANGQLPASKTLWKVAAGAGISGAVLFALLRGGTPAPTDVPATPAAAAPPPAVQADERPSSPLVPGAQVSKHRAPAAPGAPEDVLPSATAQDPTLPTPATPTPATPTPATTPATPELTPPSERRAVEVPRPTEKSPRPSERTEPKTASRAPVATTEAPPAPAQAPSASAPSETALLRDARLALNGDPARALALTEQHRSEYPGGGFAQEREVIAITALARLGRTSEARSRAERFRSAYPTSPYIERIDRAVPP